MGVGDWNEYLERRGGKEYDILPERFDYLRETEGLLTYQEQFLLDAKVYAGWNIAYSDKHIRKNKDIENDIKLKNKFIQDSTKRGFPIDVIEKVWAEIVDVVKDGYGFNKSHSASYAMTSFQTAWLKCYYPEHFYASLMSIEDSDKHGQAKIAYYIAECKKLGISIAPPDINDSSDEFVVTEKGINYRITAITHVGESAIKHINDLKPIKSFDDFMERAEKRYARKNVVENLIKAGCFDFDNENRAELLIQFEKSRMTKKELESYVKPSYVWNDTIKAKWEKEVLGLYLSNHPMEKYGFYPLENFKEKEECIQGGEVVEVAVIRDRNNNEMAFVTLDTLFGLLKVIVFSSVWSKEDVRNTLIEGNTVIVKGTKSANDVLLSSVEILK